MVTDGARPAAGIQFGRFLVLRCLGAGGMGLVYAAYDPLLDRKVALKLLHQGAPERAKTRTTHEAQAMARLSHPNVVQVYEVGTVGEQVFIAMELVEGGTLADWLLAEPRRSTEIVRCFELAGRGLAAAHAAGLVHRDFKPDNVLVARDGRVRVTDFGLAASPIEASDGGALAGTPAYLAPEQVAFEAVDARADQFSYCVALYEALYRARPFVGSTIDELRTALLLGPKPNPPRHRHVPGSIRQLLARGLERHPQDRFPSMDALLSALSVRPRARLWLVGLAVTAALVALLAGVASRSRPPLCEGGAAKLTGVWDERRRAELDQSFSRVSDASLANVASASVRRSLDDYTRRWASMYTDACEATRVRGEQSEELLDRRMACLTSRLEEVGQLIQLFLNADRPMVEAAPEAAAQLTSLSACANVASLMARVPLPGNEEARARAAAIRRELAQVKALLDAARLQPALAPALHGKAEAERLAYQPLVGEAWYLIGELRFRAGEFVEAQRAYMESAIAAQSGADDERVFRASLGAGDALNRLGRQDEALEQSRIAQAVFVRLARPAELEPPLHDVRGRLLSSTGHHEEARQEFMAALALRERSLPPGHVAIGGSLKNLGGACLSLGRAEEARSYLRRALEIRETSLGPDHPAVATVLTDLGSAELALGDASQARAHLERAIAIRQRSLGPQHPDVATTLVALARLEDKLGRRADAARDLEHALRIREDSLGAQHPDTVAARGRLRALSAAGPKLRPAPSP